MAQDIYIDVNYLTESERDAILQVLAKDEDLRKQEKRRISKLKNELDEIKSRGASEEEIKFSRVCARCRSPFGLVFNTGALCPRCEARVCKECRRDNSSKWLCILCAKIREVRAESGAWFFEQEKKKSDRPQLYGSALVRASFRRAKLPSYGSHKDFDPGSPPVITQMNLQGRVGGLRRPVAVRMSQLAEKQSEEVNEQTNSEEVNQNYKQYVKATPVAKTVEEVESDEQGRDSFSSCSSTPRGTPVKDAEGKAFEEPDEEVFDSAPEETVFDHLTDKGNSETESEGNKIEESDDNKDIEVAIDDGYTRGEEVQSYEEKVNNWEMDQKQSEDTVEQANKEVNVEVISSWHQVAYEWTESGTESPAQDAQSAKHLLDPRPASPDSETTGEFFTPLATPLQSGTATPALSEHGPSEGGTGSGSEIFVDADDATPIEGGTTPVSELSDKDAGADNVGGVTATQPETTFETAVVDDGAKPSERHRRPVPDDDTDSIDRAFASYERDNPNASVKTLKDQLNILSMGSRESIVSYYSEAGDGRFGNVAVKGEVLFGIKYDKKKNQLEVQIHRAKDIAAADEKKGKSDPYVKVYLLPDKTKGGKRKTKTKRNTLEPDFDEILRFKIGFDEMLTRTLWLSMWNHDTFGHNDFLGEVMLPLDTYQESGFSWDDPSPNWYPLRERRSEPSLMTYCGDLTVSLKFEPGQESLKDKKKKKKLGGRLHIKLREARNLPAKDANGFSDPFVKRPLPKLFDKKASEPEESKIKAGESVEKTKVSQEQVLFTSESRSHENLAFEEEEQHTEAKDISMDSSTAVATTLEATTREESQEVKQAEESGNDSGISESHLNGSDVTKVDDTKTGLNGVEKEEPTRDMQPALKSIGSLAIGLASFSPPEIKVDKPKTLFSVAEGKSSSTDASPQSPRRKTDTEIKKKTLSPLADTRRRHSDFVSAPISVNEELAREDLKKRGFNLLNKKVPSDETVRKGSVPEVVGSSRGPQWSPRLERKKQDDAKKTKKKEERRKTLAELALEAGYTVKVEESPADTQVPNQTIEVKNQTNEDENKKNEETHERLLSEHGHEHYSGIPVTGELYVSLRYDMQSTKFEVQIHSANNLACANPKSGSSDPYVKTYLLPDKRSKRKTKTKNDTLNPKYDEILEYVIGYDELLTRTLQMSVWHKVIGRNDFLGEVRIPMNEFIESCGNSLQQSISKWFTLTDQSDVTDGLPSVPCELVLALKYVTADKIKLKKGRKKGELQVHLLEARNLPGMDYDGMSDPYCKCYLLPDKKGKWKNKSPVIKRTLNPTFNHKFSYEELSLDDLKEKVLEIVIYDFDLASSDEFLGGVRLGLGTSSNEWDDATEDECQIWQTMLSRSNVWIQVVIPLRSSMVSMKKVSEQIP